MFVSPADVDPPELDSLLDASETGLGLRDDAPELASEAVNWHWVDSRCMDCARFDWVDGVAGVEQLGCVAHSTLSESQLTIILLIGEQ